jgi:predicted transcriptional regulator
VTPQRTYGTLYGMFKTTVYLPDDLKAELARLAEETGRSEAELIREGIRLAVARQAPPTPTIGIQVSADPHFAEHVDEHLVGFGQQ